MSDFKYIIWVEGTKIRGISTGKEIGSSIDKVIENANINYPNRIPDVEDGTMFISGKKLCTFCVKVTNSESGKNIACYYIIPDSYGALFLQDKNGKYVFNSEKMERVTEMFEEKKIIWTDNYIYDVSQYVW